MCGGGRYDGLIEQLGGKPAPAVGFGLGIERLLLLMQEPACRRRGARRLRGRARCDARCRGDARCEALRAAGVACSMHAGGGAA